MIKAVLTDDEFTGPDFIQQVVKPVQSTELLWNEVLRQEWAGGENANAYLKHWHLLATTFHGDHSLHTSHFLSLHYLQ